MNRAIGENAVEIASESCRGGAAITTADAVIALGIAAGSRPFDATTL